MADKDIREDIGAPEAVPLFDGPRSEGGPAATWAPEPPTPIDGARLPPARASDAGDPARDDALDDDPLSDVPLPGPEAAASPVDRQAADVGGLSAPGAGEADAHAAAAPPVAPPPTDPPSAGPDLWRTAIADALADVLPADPSPAAASSPIVEGRAVEDLAGDAPGAGLAPGSTPAQDTSLENAPVAEADHGLFTAAQDLFLPPDVQAEPHLITLGRRFDPSACVSPVPQTVAPSSKPALASGPWWTTIAWGAALRTAARYTAYAAGGYLALVLVLIVLFRFVNPPGSMLMLTQALTGTEIDRTWMPLEAISRNLVQAVIVSEDGRFCEHSGIDTAAIRESIERASHGTPRGASTISMQVIKNLFLWNAKSYVRKVIEIPLTLSMELIWPKSRIIEVYLNIAEWGPGVFGAEAAARHHFGKPAARLGEREAALLAAVLPNPLLRNAGAPNQHTSAKARVVQSRVRAYGAVASCVVSRAATPPAAAPTAVGPSRTLRKTAPPKAAPSRATPSKAAAPPKPPARKKAPPADDWAPTLNFGPP